MFCRYITDADLQFFKDRIERDAAPSGAKPWEHMMDKRGSGFSYSAWRSFVAVLHPLVGSEVCEFCEA